MICDYYIRLGIPACDKTRDGFHEPTVTRDGSQYECRHCHIRYPRNPPSKGSGVNDA